jgi:hypothetical protein
MIGLSAGASRQNASQIQTTDELTAETLRSWVSTCHHNEAEIACDNRSATAYVRFRPNKGLKSDGELSPKSAQQRTCQPRKPIFVAAP